MVFKFRFEWDLGFGMRFEAESCLSKQISRKNLVLQGLVM